MELNNHSNVNYVFHEYANQAEPSNAPWNGVTISTESSLSEAEAGATGISEADDIVPIPSVPIPVEHSPQQIEAELATQEKLFAIKLKLIRDLDILTKKGIDSKKSIHEALLNILLPLKPHELEFNRMTFNKIVVCLLVSHPEEQITKDDLKVFFDDTTIKFLIEGRFFYTSVEDFLSKINKQSDLIRGPHPRCFQILHTSIKMCYPTYEFSRFLAECFENNHKAQKSIKGNFTADYKNHCQAKNIYQLEIQIVKSEKTIEYSYKKMMDFLAKLATQPFQSAVMESAKLGAMARKLSILGAKLESNKRMIFAHLDHFKEFYQPNNGKNSSYVTSEKETIESALSCAFGIRFLVLEVAADYLRRQEVMYCVTSELEVPLEDFKDNSHWFAKVTSKSKKSLSQVPLKKTTRAVNSTAENLPKPVLLPLKSISLDTPGSKKNPPPSMTRTARKGNKNPAKKKHQRAKPKKNAFSETPEIFFSQEIANARVMSTAKCLKQEPVEKRFLRINQKYHELCYQVLETIDSSTRKGIQGELSYQRVISVQEIQRHAHFEGMGVVSLYKTMQKKDWTNSREIIPNCILDLFLQMEQLLRFACITETNSLVNEHQLSFVAKQMGYFDRLTPTAQEYLLSIDLGTIWTRYPYSSLGFYLGRNKLSRPKGLNIVELSLNPIFSQIHKQTGNLFDLYASHTETFFEILSLMMENKKIPENHDLKLSKENMLEEINFLRKETLIEIPLSLDSFQLENMEENSWEWMAYKKLDVEVQRIESLMHTQNIKGARSKQFIKEAYCHILRLMDNIKFHSKNNELDFSALVYRNHLKVQLVFESLYNFRESLRTKELYLDHDLQAHHERMKDPLEMNPQAFSFNKSLQYSNQAYQLSPDARSKVEYLESLTWNLYKGFLDVLQEKDIHENFRNFVETSISMIQKHISQSIDDFNKITCSND